MVRTALMWVSIVLAVAAWPRQSAGQTTRPDVKGLISNLADPDNSVRASAQRSLYAMPSAQIVKPLIDSLSDENWEVRAEALKMLARIGGQYPSPAKEATPHVVKLLKDPVWAVRKEAADALGSMHDATVLDALKEALKADDPLVRPAVMAAIFKLGIKIDPEFFKSCLADKQDDVRKGAITWLNRNNIDDSYTPLLISMLRDDDLSLVVKAARLLGELGDPSAGDALAEALVRPANLDRPALLGGFKGLVAASLVRCRGRGAIDPIIAALPLTDNPGRWEMLGQLRILYAPGSGPSVMPFLEDNAGHEQEQACLILGCLGYPKAADALAKYAVSQTDPSRRRLAIYALGRTGEQSAVDTLVELISKDDYPPDLPREIPSPSHLPNLPAMDRKEYYTQLKDDVAEQAVWAIGVIGGEKAADALAKAMDDPRPRVRAKAVMMLAEMGDQRGLPKAIEWLSDKDFFLTRGAVAACRHYDDPRVVQALIGLIKSNRAAQIPMVESSLAGGARGGYYMELGLRWSAMEILQMRWPKDARAVLLDRLNDSQESMVREALKQLALAPDKEDIPAMMGVLTKNNGALWVQSFAGEVLCKLKVKDAFEPCLTLLEKSKNSFGTYTLPEAFGPLAGESFVEQLKAELKSPTGRHYGALRALAYANSPELAPDVMPFLEDKDWAIRQQAVITLGKMKYAKAVPTLVKMLGNNQENMYGRDIPGALLGALGDIGDKSAVEPLLEAMEKNSRPNFSGHLAATARALGQLRDKRAYEPLMRAARTYPEAAQGLALLGDRRAIEQLQITGAWAYGSAALIVAKALFDLEPQACVDTAGRLIHNSPGFDLAKVDAVRLLAKVGNAKAIEYIKLALRDDNLLVRKEARDALAKLRGGAVVPPPTTAPAP